MHMGGHLCSNFWGQGLCQPGLPHTICFLRRPPCFLMKLSYGKHRNVSSPANQSQQNLCLCHKSWSVGQQHGLVKFTTTTQETAANKTSKTQARMEIKYRPQYQQTNRSCKMFIQFYFNHENIFLIKNVNMSSSFKTSYWSKS